MLNNFVSLFKKNVQDYENTIWFLLKKNLSAMESGL